MTDEYPKDKNGTTLQVGMKVKIDLSAGMTEPMRQLAGISNEVRLGEIVAIKYDEDVNMFLAHANGSFNENNPIAHWKCEVISKEPTE